MATRLNRIPGVVLISVAAVMWGTDSLFRRPLARSTSAATIVFGEHVILVAITLPLLVPALLALWRAGPRYVLAGVGVGAGASALATILFTQAFAHGDPITPIVLQKVQPLVAVAAERFAGRYYVAAPDLHGSFDILAGVRGPENVCLDLVDEPELVRRASLHAARAYVEAYRRLYQRLTALGQPSTTWCSYLHTGPAYVPSCDFWCLVSREIADNYIRPTIEMEIAPLLDGPQALHHLDLMLRLPHLNAVQWVFGAGHGPAAKWLGVYRKCLHAGKAIQVLAEDPDDALTVLRELGPDGLWLTVCTPFANARSISAACL